MSDKQQHQDEPADRELAALLKAMPVPEPAPGFFAQVTASAAREYARRQELRALKTRWLFTGAAAALVVAFLVSNLLGVPGSDPSIDNQIPAITMTVAEPQTVNLLFASAEALENAVLTLNLPAGVELEGFPGQREISWQTSLASGRNLLPLRLLAVAPTQGELQARLEHDTRDRVFRLQLSTG